MLNPILVLWLKKFFVLYTFVQSNLCDQTKKITNVNSKVKIPLLKTSKIAKKQ